MMKRGYFFGVSFPGRLEGKASACDAGDPGSVPAVRKIPLEKEMVNPLQYSCLENPMDRGTWEATVHGIPES